MGVKEIFKKPFSLDQLVTLMEKYRPGAKTRNRKSEKLERVNSKVQSKQNERQEQAAAPSATPTTKQEDEDKDKIIADLKIENETLKRQVKEAQDILSGLVNTGMSDHYLGHTGMTVRQLAEKWGLIETKTTSNAKPKRKGMIESMLGAHKRAHPDEQLP
jgi:FtsZ-binding cell division protein ZapB